MFKIPEKKDLKDINSYPSLEQLTILKDICHQIYISRNITANSEGIINQLERIDRLFRDRENFN